MANPSSLYSDGTRSSGRSLNGKNASFRRQGRAAVLRSVRGPSSEDAATKTTRRKRPFREVFSELVSSKPLSTARLVMGKVTSSTMKGARAEAGGRNSTIICSANILIAQTGKKAEQALAQYPREAR